VTIDDLVHHRDLLIPGVVLASIMLAAAYTLAVHPTPIMGSAARPLIYFVAIVIVSALRWTAGRSLRRDATAGVTA
jgi:hypothetical protein